MWLLNKIFSNTTFMLPGLLLLAGCSTLAEQQYQDPYEGLNRKIYNFNEGLDRAILNPVSRGYSHIAPDPVEKGVSNFFDNLFYPTVVLNQFLQGKIGDSFDGVFRFAINTTLGIGGLFDVASGLGLEAKEEDFGQTFAKWGFGSGPYIVVPVLGGFTLRDGFGGVAEIPTNPVFLLEAEAQLALGVGSGIDESTQLLDARDLIKGDKYLFVRDAYVQRREFLINDGAIAEADPFLDE